MRLHLFVLLSVSAAASYGQQAPRLQQDSTVNLPAQPIGLNDLLTVNIYNQPSLSRTVRVSTEGLIRLPMLRQQVDAANVLPGELEKIIAAAYIAEGILVDPQVTVTIAEYHSHPVQVGGSVRKPLTFQAEAPVTLLEAINRAEGLSETAGSEILITKSPTGPDGIKRPGITQRIAVKDLFETGDAAANVVLTGGEEVRVPEAGRVFIIGNVKKPCTFPIKHGSEASVLQALAYSEGLLTYSTKLAYIYRREGNGPKNEIEIPLDKIMTRKSPDVPLRADDILYVPENTGRKKTLTALEKVLLIGGGAAATALVYR